MNPTQDKRPASAPDTNTAPAHEAKAALQPSILPTPTATLTEADKRATIINLLADTQRAIYYWRELNATIASLDPKNTDNITLAKQLLKEADNKKAPEAAALLTFVSNYPDRESVELGFKFLFTRDSISEKQSAGSILRKAIEIRAKEGEKAKGLITDAEMQFLRKLDIKTPRIQNKLDLLANALIIIEAQDHSLRSDKSRINKFFRAAALVFSGERFIRDTKIVAEYIFAPRAPTNEPQQKKSEGD